MVPKNRSRILGNKGVSTVFGTLLFLVLFASIVSSLYVGLFLFDKTSSAAISIDQTRLEEKIKIVGADFINENTQITGIQIENIGSKTVNLVAIYVDQGLFAQISKYLNPKETCTITFSSVQSYSPNSIICVTTENGAKTMVLQKDLLPITPTSYEQSDTIFGPLQLNYRDFKYKLDAGTDWTDGWSVPPGERIDWRIRVKNVDVKERTIDLLKYSCLALVTFGGGQRPWYINIQSITDLAGQAHLSSIAYGEEVYVVFKYETSSSTGTQQTPASGGSYNMYITFCGYYKTSSGSIIQSYGQTIPFQAVIVT